MPPTHQDSDFSPGKINKDGKMPVFDLIKRQWVYVASVDAREMCNVGTGSMHGPSVEVEGPSGRKVICSNELEAHVSMGFKVVNSKVTIDANKPGKSSKPVPVETPIDEPADDQADIDDDGEENGEIDPAHDFTNYSVKDLRKYAESAGIDHTGLTKVQLVASLNDANFVPPED